MLVFDPTALLCILCVDSVRRHHKSCKSLVLGSNMLIPVTLRRPSDSVCLVEETTVQASDLGGF